MLAIFDFDKKSTNVRKLRYSYIRKEQSAPEKGSKRAHFHQKDDSLQLAAGFPPPSPLRGEGRVRVTRLAQASIDFARSSIQNTTTRQITPEAATVICTPITLAKAPAMMLPKGAEPMKVMV